MKTVQTAEPFRLSDREKEKLTERFGESPKGVRFIGDLQKIVRLHISNREGRKSAGAAAASMRSNASAIQRAAKQLKESVGFLGDSEKVFLGQLMWTVDKQRYAPAAFSVEQVAEAAYVLEQAARKLTQGGRGGGPSLQVEALIRDVYAAYVVRFGNKPEFSMSNGNDFTFAMKLTLNAAGEPARISPQLMRNAINA